MKMPITDVREFNNNNNNNNYHEDVCLLLLPRESIYGEQDSADLFSEDQLYAEYSHAGAISWQ